tara:strand:+ start:6079 stop:7278 length:1200 start_codon:yes stop_codon:yes gene_type:complete
MMKIPIIRIPFLTEDKEFISSNISNVLDTGYLTMGGYTKKFEDLFRKFTGAKHALATSNCTSAIEIIIRSLGIEGKSIIVPTNTFLATALAVMHSGNKIIFADSDPRTFCLDPNDIKNKINRDTRAIILVHIGGIITPDYEKIKKICDENDIYLIEDCAHAHGCSINGMSAGTLGIAGAFSFFPTKTLVTGEGGIITTNDDKLYKKASMIRNHGKNPNMENKISEFGYNYRISEITAVIGVQQMQKAEHIISERRKIAGWYGELLSKVDHVSPLEIPDNIISTYYKYIINLSEEYNCAKVKQRMKGRYGVSLTGEVYIDLCHNEPIWEKYTYCGKKRNTSRGVQCVKWPSCGCEDNQKDFPGAIYLSKHHLCLPLYLGLTKEEVKYVVDALSNTLEDFK